MGNKNRLDGIEDGAIAILDILVFYGLIELDNTQLVEDLQDAIERQLEHDFGLFITASEHLFTDELEGVYDEEESEDRD